MTKHIIFQILLNLLLLNLVLSSKQNEFICITKYIDNIKDINDEFNFLTDFYKCIMEKEKNKNLFDYVKVLHKYGIEYEQKLMKNVDVSELGAEPVLALILGIMRADHFSEGTLKEFIVKGYIYKWLKRLKEIDNSL